MRVEVTHDIKYYTIILSLVYLYDESVSLKLTQLYDEMLGCCYHFKTWFNINYDFQLHRKLQKN